MSPHTRCLKKTGDRAFLLSIRLKCTAKRSTYRVLLALLANLVLTLPSQTFFLHAAMGVELRLLSLDSRGEPLGEILKKISKDTGYRISVDPEWTGLPVSVSFKNLPMDKGLRRILARLNHSIVFDDADQRISIVIKSLIHGEDLTAGGVDKAFQDGLPGALSPTKVSFGNINDPGAIQVIPPKGPGEIGTTHNQLEEIEARRAQVDPGNIEVIPPSKDGGMGVTQNDLDKIEARRSKIDPANIEVIPPTEAGAKGTTVKELKFHQNAQISKALKNKNLVPPDGFVPK